MFLESSVEWKKIISYINPWFKHEVYWLKFDLLPLDPWKKMKNLHMRFCHHTCVFSWKHLVCNNLLGIGLCPTSWYPLTLPQHPWCTKNELKFSMILFNLLTWTQSCFWGCSIQRKETHKWWATFWQDHHSQSMELSNGLGRDLLL